MGKNIVATKVIGLLQVNVFEDNIEVIFKDDETKGKVEYYYPKSLEILQGKIHLELLKYISRVKEANSSDSAVQNDIFNIVKDLVNKEPIYFKSVITKESI